MGNRGNGDPFFHGFDAAFGNFGCFGGPGSLISSVFGGRDPFDDPFFSDPFGGMLGSSFFAPLGSSPFGGSFTQMPPHGFLEHQVPQQPNKPRGPIIEEINSDDDEEKDADEKIVNPKKHRRTDKEPYVEYPNDEFIAGRKNKVVQYENAYNRMTDLRSQPQTYSFSSQSSSVTYGGANGAYYTSSVKRRSGSDGLSFEEVKDADTATGKATHKVSKGIHDKGHSVTRKLKSDGQVDTMQTLHNLNQDEIPGFDGAWNAKARKNLPSSLYCTGDVAGHEQTRGANRGGWALPSTGQAQPWRSQGMNWAATPPVAAGPSGRFSSHTTAPQCHCAGGTNSGDGHEKAAKWRRR